MAPDLESDEEDQEVGDVHLPCFKNATTIKLDLYFLGLALPSQGIFTRLTDLSLNSVQLRHGPCDLGNLVSSPRCPCLQKLSIDHFSGLGNLSIHSESLLQMELKRCELSQVTIVTPILQKLSLYASLPATAGDPSELVANITASQIVSLVWMDTYDPRYFHLGNMGQLRELQTRLFIVYGTEFHREYNRPCLMLLQRFQDISDYEYLLGDITVLPQITFFQLELCNEGHAFGASLFHLLRMCIGLRKLLLVYDNLENKPWRHILTDPGFLRRYRAFHRAPPLLGYLHNLGQDTSNPAGIPPLAPISAASPLWTQAQPKFTTSWVLDCRHGRVLIHVFMPDSLVVWDPITGCQKKLGLPVYDHRYYAGAVLCAVDGCDHLDCHDGPFIVVFAGSSDNGDDYDFETWVAIYSSESGQWSAPISIYDDWCILMTKPTLLIGDTLYFIAEDNILKFDLAAHELSVIESPAGYSYEAIPMEVDGGRLGFVLMDDKGFASRDDNYIYMLSWQDDANDGNGGWAQHLVMELETLLPKVPLCSNELVGLLEGTNTVFIRVPCVGLYTLDLKSREVKKVGERGAYYAILPYTCFYTPDLAKGTRHHLHEDAMIDPPT